MSRNIGRSALLAAALMLVGAPAGAQYFYGPGYWGGYGGYGGGAHTVAGDAAQGAAVLAAGMGQYNVQTAQARSINADTALRYNQYLYQSRLESSRIYHEKLARERARNDRNAEAVRARLRDNPNAIDIARGDALNVILDELSDPRVSPGAIAYAAKSKLGGETIRDIPFNYASAAISTSVHQLTQGGAPAALKDRPEFAPDRTALRAVAAEIRQEATDAGAPKPETLKRAKDLIKAAQAKAESVLPKGSADRQAADKYLKALYGFVRMLETPAVDVLLAGVEKHPDATLGDLLKFMATFNLRFGAAQTPRQKAIYQQLYPMLVQVRNEVAPTVAAAPAPQPVGEDAPLGVFEGLTYDQLDGKAPPAAPAPQPLK